MDKRFFLTILLCMAVFLLWQTLFAPRLRPPPAAPAPPGPTTPPPPAIQSPPQPPEIPADEAQARDPITIRTKRYVARFSNKGAVLLELVLKFNDTEIQLIEPTTVRDPSFMMELGRVESGTGADPAAFRSKKKMDHHWHVIEPPPAADSIGFRTRVGDLEYEKLFFLVDKPPDVGAHVLRVDVTVKNVSAQTDQTIWPHFALTAFNGIRRDSDYRYLSYLAGFWGLEKGGEVKFDTFDADSVAPKHSRPTKPNGRVANGVKNRYFALALLPKEEGDVNHLWMEPLTDAELGEAGGFRNIKFRVEATPRELKAGQSSVTTFYVFAGPIRRPELREPPRPIPNLLSWAWIDAVGDLILKVLNFFFGISGNYAIAIVFTTLTVRVLLFYFNKKSQVSMAKMTQLAPKLEYLKARYKDDPQRLNQETWKLWKEEKVNPAAGCLPMFIQLPVFVGMYSVVDLAVDLRRQPFVGWIQDLSQPDRLIDFHQSVNLIFGLSLDAFNLLPILMTIVWVLQGMMAPKPKDPQMMLNYRLIQIMPLFFGLMSYGLASGLSWYFLVNALLAMTEQKIIKKYFLPRGGSGAVIGGAPVAS